MAGSQGGWKHPYHYPLRWHELMDKLFGHCWDESAPTIFFPCNSLLKVQMPGRERGLTELLAPPLARRGWGGVVPPRKIDLLFLEEGTVDSWQTTWTDVPTPWNHFAPDGEDVRNISLRKQLAQDQTPLVSADLFIVIIHSFRKCLLNIYNRSLSGSARLRK